MEVLFSASLIVGFIAGMVALFAPCCITFLLPAYLGQIVRSRAKIFLGTLIFSLGIATIMLPLAIGFKIILNLLSQYHLFIYYFGALLMLFFGFATLMNWKLNFHMPKNTIGVTDSTLEFSSLYTLGLVSGLSTACCAPVLAGAIVLAGLSPALFQTILVGLSYVAGMVFPLFIGALFFESNPLLPVRKFLNKKIGAKYNASAGNLISGIIFIAMGLWVGLLNYQGKLAMGNQSQKINQIIGNLNLTIGGFVSEFRIIDWFLGILIFIVIIFVVKAGIKK